MNDMATARHDWDDLTARDIMQTQVLTVSVDTPLSEVERLLSEHRISGLPVTDEAGHLVGVVSIRDLIEHYTEDPDARPRRGRGFYQLDTEELADEDIEAFEVPEEAEETAGDIMTAEVYAVPADAKLPEVARRMVELRIHRILVRENGKHVGLISTFDLLGALAKGTN